MQHTHTRRVAGSGKRVALFQLKCGRYAVLALVRRAGVLHKAALLAMACAASVWQVPQRKAGWRAQTRGMLPLYAGAAATQAEARVCATAGHLKMLRRKKVSSMPPAHATAPRTRQPPHEAWLAVLSAVHAEKPSCAVVCRGFRTCATPRVHEASCRHKTSQHNVIKQLHRFWRVQACSSVFPRPPQKARQCFLPLQAAS